MRVLSPAAAYVASHPLAFCRQVLKGFKTSQGLLLAGAVAYYALLSVVPLLILVVIGLSHFIPQAELLARSGATSNGWCRGSRARSSRSCATSWNTAT